MLEQQIHEQEMTEMIHAESGLKAICCISCARYHLNSGIADQCSQRREIASNKLVDKIAN